MWRLLLAVLLLPVAAAAPTIDALQEPVVSRGPEGAVAEFSITPAQVGRLHYIVFRTGSNAIMAVELVDESGETVWELPKATNGVQPFHRNATAGLYKLVLRGPGQAQVLHRVLDANASGALDGTHAFLFVPQQAWRVDFGGNASVEWAPLGRASQTLVPPANATAEKGQPYVITLRGEEDAAYTIGLAPAPASETATTARESPTPTWLALGAAAIAAIALRRRA